MFGEIRTFAGAAFPGAASSYLEGQAGGAWSPAGAFSFHMWAKTDGLGALGECLFNKWQGTIDRSMILAGDTLPTVSWNILSTGAIGYGVSNTRRRRGVWQSYCGVFTGSSGSIQLYIDGIATAAATAVGAAIINGSTLPLRLGNRTDGAGHEFQGMMAHLATWDVALTRAEVFALASGVLPSSIARGSLSSYYPLWGLSPTHGGATEPTLTRVGTVGFATDIIHSFDPVDIAERLRFFGGEAQIGYRV
jgi:hypothetical protein